LTPPTISPAPVWTQANSATDALVASADGTTATATPAAPGPGPGASATDVITVTGISGTFGGAAFGPFGPVTDNVEVDGNPQIPTAATLVATVA
jgi:hypothetical protein